MLAGGGLLLAVSAIGEDWGELRLTPESVGSIVYLALIGSAVAFVGLTVLLRHLTAQAMSFLAMLLPFGALLSGQRCTTRPSPGGRWPGRCSWQSGC